MPMVPKDQRESYRQWAKDNAKSQMDERAWVHESDYSEYLNRHVHQRSIDMKRYIILVVDPNDSSFPISIATDSVEETVLSIIQQGYDLAAEETDKDTIIQHLLEKECWPDDGGSYTLLLVDTLKISYQTVVFNNN